MIFIAPLIFQNNKMAASKKITWISILQGWAMLLVVLGHCWIWTSNEWRFDFCYGVHMPLFMFVSGGLFYLTRINKQWAWKDVIIDKLKRLGIPYVSFITLAYGLKILFAGHVKHSLDLSVSSFLKGFIFPIQSGMKEMWFIAALLILMFCYPIYGRILQKKIICVVFFVFCVLFTYIFNSYTGGGVFNWQGALHYLVYFFGGILFFRYNMIRYVKSLLGGGNFNRLIFSNLYI